MRNQSSCRLIFSVFIGLVWLGSGIIPGHAEVAILDSWQWDSPGVASNHGVNFSGPIVGGSLSNDSVLTGLGGTVLPGQGSGFHSSVVGGGFGGFSINGHSYAADFF